MEKESRKLAYLSANLKVENESGFENYLKEVWIDLISRSTKNEIDKHEKNLRQDLIGLNKIIFSKYYNLPGIIGNRLFRVFDSNNNGVLEYNEFRRGMLNLFCGNYEKTLRFIFDFYDFDGDGKISKEDIKVVLLYISNKNKNIKEIYNGNNVKNSKILSEININDIINLCFENQLEELNYIEFTNIVNNVNSKVYFLIYIFLLKKKPFSNKIIELYITGSNSQNSKRDKLLYLPYEYLSNSNLKLNTCIGNFNSSNYQSEMNLHTSISNSKKLSNNQSNYFSLNGFKFFSLSKNFQSLSSLNDLKVLSYNNNFNKSSIYLSNKFELLNNNYLFEQNLKKTIYEAKVPNDIFKEVDKNICPNDLYFDDEEDIEDDNNLDKIKDNLESEKNNYEGYIYKFNNGKMVKVWFKLFYKDLFYYKKKEDNHHWGMHNLSDLFFKEETTKKLNDKIYYSFSIIFPSKKRTYYCDNKTEFMKWEQHLRIATNFSDILQKYKILDVLGSGSFSIVRLAINKKTNQKVAVKIMDKKKMNSSRLDSARTEIEIMKICKFPYIIKFIEEYETIDYIYIFMEYCSGGTLYEFFKKRNYDIPEEMAANIIYKLCLTTNYFHSYGITHRDLKPENVLMTSKEDDADIRILDFGLSKIIGPNEKCSEPYGTIIYVAPEIILKKPYSKNVDCWSIGIIAYILLFGKLPFYDKDKSTLKRIITENQPKYKSPCLKIVSNESINFVQNLLIKDPDKRMTLSQALEHKWFKKYIQNTPIDITKNNLMNINEIFNRLNLARGINSNNNPNFP